MRFHVLHSNMADMKVGQLRGHEISLLAALMGLVAALKGLMVALKGLVVAIQWQHTSV